MTTPDETPLHILQAESLRRLADAIEQNPELAEVFKHAFGRVHAPFIDVDSQTDAREDLARFAEVMKEAGAEVSVKNGPARCYVYAKLGVVVTYRTADPAQMEGPSEPPRKPAYEPLVVPS